MSYGSAEAKQAFFLTAEDLKPLPRESLYLGFGTGRASYLFNEDDLKAAAIKKYGEEEFVKKQVARKKREENKRKRAMADEENKRKRAMADENARQAEIRANPELPKKEAAKKQRQEKKIEAIITMNKQIIGKPWKLTILSPEKVAGTPASLDIRTLPPFGEPNCIDCMDTNSPAYSFGNIYGFKGNSSEKDAEMVFETKWKVFGKRHTGKLSVRVRPSDKLTTNDGNVEEKSLMVTGKFDSGVNDGVRRWTFKGYR